MIDMYNPFDWYWLVTQSNKYWSSATGEYVTKSKVPKGFPVTNIATEEELDDVLRPYSLPSPVITDNDIRKEASCRICEAVGARCTDHLTVVMSNMQREVQRILHKSTAMDLSQSDQERLDELFEYDKLIEDIRACSDKLETSRPVDYKGDEHWPTKPSKLMPKSMPNSGGNWKVSES